MIKPRHLYEATSAEVDRIDGLVALTFRTEGETDLTILLPIEAACRLRESLPAQAGPSTAQE